MYVSCLPDDGGGPSTRPPTTSARARPPEAATQGSGSQHGHGPESRLAFQTAWLYSPRQDPRSPSCHPPVHLRRFASLTASVGPSYPDPPLRPLPRNSEVLRLGSQLPSPSCAMRSREAAIGSLLLVALLATPFGFIEGETPPLPDEAAKAPHNPFLGETSHPSPPPPRQNRP